ncbi:hypothetical protein BDV95DRAFT_463261, partial [Massariosphaeria phaeospora]
MRKDRVKPTDYPVLPFHLIRSAQLVSSIIVAGIMSYFLWQLKQDHYRLPWTFILLLAVSLLTILSLTTTIVLHCFHGLNVSVNLLINSIIVILWSVSLILLSWWSSGTLSHVCNRDSWEDETGVAVCRAYKALFSFTLVGVASTLAALVLDIHTQRTVRRRGRFTQLQRMDDLQNMDNKGAPSVPGGVLGAESNPNPAARNPRQRGGEGYAVPHEQFAYNDDIAYQGAGGRRSLGAR